MDKQTLYLFVSLAIVIVMGTVTTTGLLMNLPTIYLAIGGSILGTAIMTVLPFLIKKINRQELTFNIAYVMTMLIAAIISTAILPLYFIGNTLPINSNPFILIGTVCISAIINYLINIGVTYLLNQTATMKKLAIDAGATVIENDSPIKKLIVIGIVAVLCFGLCCSSTFAAVTVSKTVTATGNITAVGSLGIYSDKAGTTQLTTVNWGNLAPGSSTTIQIFVKNAANYQMTFAFTASGYNPASMATTSTLSWNYMAGTVVAPGNIQQIDLTMTLSNDALAGSFNFNIIISGTQTG